MRCSQSSRGAATLRLLRSYSLRPGMLATIPSQPLSAAQSLRRLLLPAELSAAARRGPPPGVRLCRESGESMGTTWTVQWSQPEDAHALRPLLVQALARLVLQMSHWMPDSDLCHYGRVPAGTWWPLAPEFAMVMRAALEIAAASDGAFDPSAGPLVDAWGFGPPGPRAQAPSVEELAAARARIGWQRLRMDGERLLQPGGIALDLSAIAKGYAVDHLAELLQAHGVEHYLVEIGGELRGQGCKPDGAPWWVALEQPPDGSPGASLPESVLALDGLAVASSGDYRRHADYGAGRVAHSLDPRSGTPLANGIAMLSLVHASTMQADAWSTALGVLGVEAGMRMATRHGLAARFVERLADGSFHEHLSPAWQALEDAENVTIR